MGKYIISISLRSCNLRYLLVKPIVELGTLSMSQRDGVESGIRENTFDTPLLI